MQRRLLSEDRRPALRPLLQRLVALGLALSGPALRPVLVLALVLALQEARRARTPLSRAAQAAWLLGHRRLEAPPLRRLGHLRSAHPLVLLLRRLALHPALAQRATMHQRCPDTWSRRHTWLTDTPLALHLAPHLGMGMGLQAAMGRQATATGLPALGR